MCSKKNSAFKTGACFPGRDEMSGVDAALSFRPPVLRETRGCTYIELYAFDPALGQMRRKRIKINRIAGKNNRRTYARGVIKRLNDQLNHGWNPWIAKDVANLQTIADAFDRYESHIEKMYSDNCYRKETYAGYKSYLKILRLYVSDENPIYYIYQFNRRYCSEFLDYIFIERDNGAQTRNNYLTFLRVFCGWLLEKGFIEARPTDGIKPIDKRLYKKERTVIPLDVVGKIAARCREKDPYFLAACYLEYYCFIRPVELSRLRIEHFNLKAGTITIPGSCAKNHKRQTITMPKKVLHYLVELGVFSAPTQDYLFSKGLRPGPEQIDAKIFRDHWQKLRKPLKLARAWKFYSLKDTGITEMLRKDMTNIEVRDQARHSSLAITDLYTDHSNDVNLNLLEFDGSL